MDAYTLQRAANAEGVAREWEDYARSLEQKLAIYASNYMGMEAVKNAAIAELSRVDPGNYLTVQHNRQRIADAARAEALQRTKK